MYPSGTLGRKERKRDFQFVSISFCALGKELSVSEARHRGICASIPSAWLCKPFALKTQPRPNIRALFPERFSPHLTFKATEFQQKQLYHLTHMHVYNQSQPLFSFPPVIAGPARYEGSMGS